MSKANAKTVDAAMRAARERIEKTIILRDFIRHSVDGAIPIDSASVAKLEAAARALGWEG